MLSRVGIKLERSAPPSRRGSPPRAGTPSCENHVSPLGHVSPTFPTGLTTFINYDRLSSPVTIGSGSTGIPRSINEDLLVTVEGDAHLLRLQQVLILIMKVKYNNEMWRHFIMIIDFLKSPSHFRLFFFLYLGLSRTNESAILLKKRKC